MKKHLKTICITLLSLLCFVCFTLGCSTNKKVKIEDFNDEEITVSLGENYRLELAPIVVDGVYFEVTAQVVTSSGKSVALTNGYFTLSEVDGYIITYTAKSAGNSQKRTVTLKVENQRAPNVILGECDTTYEVGETFSFPTITVYDLAGEQLVPTANVYKIEGEERIWQEVQTENSFLCEEVGEYIFQATATNSFSVTGVKELKFYVSGFEVGEVEGFSNAGVQNDVVVNSKYTSGFEWIDKTDAAMGNRQGVLKIDVNKTNQQRNVVTVYPKQSYESYLEKKGEEYKNTKFVVTMYVSAPVGSIPEMYAHFTSYRIKDIKYNMWYDYTFDAKSMLNAYTSILTAEEKIANATDAQTLATAEKELSNLYNNALSVWGTFTTTATVYIDRIAFVEEQTKTTVAKNKSFEIGQEISLAKEMPVEGYHDVEYTVSLEGKPVAITSDKFTPEYASDNYTVVASVKDSVNALNDNAEFKFKVTANNKHVAGWNRYTSTVNKGDEVIEPSIEVYDQSNRKVEGYKITTRREFVSNAGVRSEASEFTTAKSGTFEYTVTAEKEGVKFIKTTTVKVGPFGKNEVISLSRADALELFGTTKGTLLTQDDLNTLKKSFVDINTTSHEKVIRFTKNNSDTYFDLNFKPVHTAQYYKSLASIKPAVKITLYLASANTNITEFSVEMFQNKDCKYIVPANAWTTIEVPVDAMIAAMEDNRLYPLSTWTHCALRIRPNATGEEYSIANSELNLFLGDIALAGDENGDNYVQDW